MEVGAEQKDKDLNPEVLVGRGGPQEEAVSGVKEGGFGDLGRLMKRF